VPTSPSGKTGVSRPEPPFPPPPDELMLNVTSRVMNWVVSSARNVTVLLLDWVARPVIRPEAGSRLRPSGSGSALPGSTENVTGPSAFATTSCPTKTGPFVLSGGNSSFRKR
jgi:hypothetical protein